MPAGLYTNTPQNHLITVTARRELRHLFTTLKFAGEKREYTNLPPELATPLRYISKRIIVTLIGPEAERDPNKARRSVSQEISQFKKEFNGAYIEIVEVKDGSTVIRPS